ncbi:MAG: SWF/SNF helicase family protein, partial [Actinomycetota bacterium]|nr:SWF/SNF helicase family protein [Actinomycetota bacterium]
RLADEAVDLAELILAREGTKSELWRASGDFDWKLRHATGVAKAGYVAEFVRLLLENDEPVVLFGWHRDVYAIWAERLADFNPAFYTGTESPNQKLASRDAFLNGDSRLLVMSLRAGSGLDGLQDVAHVAVFGELDWSPGMHDQCIGRLHRDGQAESVVAYFLVSDHGADPVMAEVLSLKRMQSEPLRDPDAPLFEQTIDAGDRVRRLADDVMRRRRSTTKTVA